MALVVCPVLVVNVEQETAGKAEDLEEAECVGGYEIIEHSCHNVCLFKSRSLRSLVVPFFVAHAPPVALSLHRSPVLGDLLSSKQCHVLP